MKPELFKDEIFNIKLSVDDLRTGFLRENDDNNCILNLPVIDKEEEYNKEIYSNWKRVKI